MSTTCPAGHFAPDYAGGLPSHPRDGGTSESEHPNVGFVSDDGGSRRQEATNWIAIGIVLGLPLGAAFGVFMVDNLALGLLLGASVGLTFGVAADTLRKRRNAK